MRQVVRCAILLAAAWGTTDSAIGHPDDAGQPAIAQSADQRLSHLMETIVREAMPREFEDHRDWGHRQQIVTGLDVEPKGLGLRISKRERGVQHGFWRKYSVTVRDPQEALQLRIENMRSPSAGEFRWDLFVRLRANVDVRFEHWNLGVKLLNAHSNADITLLLHADCSLKFAIENAGADQGPVVVLSPIVHAVGLRLADLEVHRFGEIRGSVAEEVGNSLEDVLEKLLQSQEKTIRARAQKSINQHADDLRIPLREVLSSRWSALLLGI